MGFSPPKTRSAKARLTIAVFGPLAVSSSEVAACNARNAHGLEVARRHHDEISRGIAFAGAWPAATWNMSLLPAMESGAKSVHTAETHTWQSRHALPQLAEKLDRPLRRVAVQPRIDRHNQQVLRAKADVDAGRGFADCAGRDRSSKAESLTWRSARPSADYAETSGARGGPAHPLP